MFGGEGFLLELWIRRKCTWDKGNMEEGPGILLELQGFLRNLSVIRVFRKGGPDF